MTATVESEISGARRRRRWTFVVVATIVGLAAAGTWFWYGWLPNNRPDLETGERYGIDVSNHQGDIDWDAVANDDMTFAYIKATEGADFVDDQFARNWKGAAAAGLDRGAYHFFTFCRSGAEQAANFLRTVPHDTDALPPVIDLELGGNCAKRPTRAELRREVDAFLTSVEAETGQTVVLYIGDDFEERYRMRAELDRPIWHRRVLIRPDLEDWWIWQVDGHASVAGIDGGTDLDVMRGTRPPE